ncbi:MULTISPECIES: hypothetical protein [unclassified Nocardioides]|uniref:hypothetical protein n=1 Tax=unclassified Nocardioides TaxID=2615069 RepID=UPI0006FBE942|nr:MULTISPECIES: hypothetical protein [unclassified Nocardioides]KRA38923.1 hypothetical protein ASD81_10150 [Nocardioides sp. Root614]KRA92882.1 hypothetical protein ASD84_10415 [Nocardioides sp. Root682]
MSAPIELDVDRLRALLAELDNRLAQRGISAGLYVVGGAAIALTVSDRRLTLDVDALATDQAVYDEAAIIARQHGLPPTWLNPSAAPWIPPRPPQTLPATPGLHVEYAPLEHLLAMKMAAMRERDYPDIAELARSLGLANADAAAFERLLRDAYGDDDILEMALGVRRDEDLNVEVRRLARGTRTIVQHFFQ